MPDNIEVKFSTPYIVKVEVGRQDPLLVVQWSSQNLSKGR